MSKWLLHLLQVFCSNAALLMRSSLSILLQFANPSNILCTSVHYFSAQHLSPSIIVGVVLLYSLFNLPQKEGTIHESKDFYVFGLL